jgi:predicted nucleic acid-binding protein
MIALDTNVIVRLVIADDPGHFHWAPDSEEISP